MCANGESGINLEHIANQPSILYTLVLFLARERKKSCMYFTMLLLLFCSITTWQSSSTRIQFKLTRILGPFIISWWVLLPLSSHFSSPGITLKSSQTREKQEKRLFFIKIWKSLIPFYLLLVVVNRFVRIRMHARGRHISTETRHPPRCTICRGESCC